MQNGFLSDEQKKTLCDVSKAQHRRAFEISKQLRSISNNKVSFVISQEVTIDGPNLDMRIKTKIHEYPEIRVFHEKTDDENEYLLDYDFTDAGSSD
jgi:hypothetical protein